MMVIVDSEGIVRSVSFIPGTQDIECPAGYRAYFPVKFPVPKIGEKFIPDFELNPFMSVVEAMKHDQTRPVD